MASPSSSGASTVLKSTPEKRNFLLLTRLLIAGATELLRSAFDVIHPPHTLSAVLSSSAAKAKLKRPHLTKLQVDILYPSPGIYGKSADFDITLLFKLFREVCGLTPPVVTGWDKLPAVTDKSQEADLARLKFYRNSIYGHTSSMEVTEVDFCALWPEISYAMLRLAKSISPAKETEWKNAIGKLLKDPLTPEDEHNVTELKSWYLSDEATKESLVKIQSAVETTHQQVKEVKSTMKLAVKDSTNEVTEALKQCTDQMLKKMETVIGSKDSSQQAAEWVSSVGHELHPESDVLESAVTNKSNHLSSEIGRTIPLNDPSVYAEILQDEYKRRASHFQPLSWCDSLVFDLEKIYVDLKVVRREKERFKLTDETVELEFIFKPNKGCASPTSVSIEANPGMGKTTLSLKLAHEWAMGRMPEVFPQFELVLLLKCKEMETGDIWKAIEEQLLPGDIEESVKSGLFQFIKNNQEKVLLIFDGLDEVADTRCKHLEDFLRRKFLPKCFLVVTSRQEKGIQVRKYFDTVLEIKGYSEQEAEKYVRLYFQQNKGMSRAFLQLLKERKNLMELVINPYHTILLCVLFEDKRGELPSTRTELYDAIVCYVIKRYCVKEGLLFDENTVFENFNDEIIELGKLACVGLQSDRLYFLESELGKINARIVKLGFLWKKASELKCRPDHLFCFSHKTFQEYFAAKYLVDQMDVVGSGADATWKKLADHTKFLQVLLFMSGILGIKARLFLQDLGRIFLDSLKGDVIARLFCKLLAENQFRKELVSVVYPFFPQSLEVDGWYYDSDMIKSLADVLRVIPDEGTRQSALGTPLQSLHITVKEVEIIIEALKINRTLTTLKLQLCTIDNAVTVAVADIIRVNTTLLSLDLSQCKIGDTGALAISEAVRENRTLTSLDVSENEMSEEGAGSIAEAAIVNTALLSLDLSFACMKKFPSYIYRHSFLLFMQTVSLLSQIHSVTLMALVVPSTFRNVTSDIHPTLESFITFQASLTLLIVLSPQKVQTLLILQMLLALLVLLTVVTPLSITVPFTLLIILAFKTVLTVTPLTPLRLLFILKLPALRRLWTCLTRLTPLKELLTLLTFLTILTLLTLMRSLLGSQTLLSLIVLQANLISLNLTAYDRTPYNIRRVTQADIFLNICFNIAISPVFLLVQLVVFFIFYELLKLIQSLLLKFVQSVA